MSSSSEDTSLKPFVFANHSTYYRIAFDNYQSAVHYAKKSTITEDYLERLDEIQKYGSIRYECSMISLIFSAMTAEAYINYYAINRLTKTQFDKHYDRLQLYLKWCVIPLVINGKALNREGAALKRLENLIWLRNRLVHYKSTSVDLQGELERQIRT